MVKLISVDVQFEELNWEMFERLLKKNPSFATSGYPLSYLLGKHLILELRDDVKRMMAGKFNVRFFHDTLTANGELPMFLLRKVFDLKLTRLESG